MYLLAVAAPNSHLQTHRHSPPLSLPGFFCCCCSCSLFFYAYNSSILIYCISPAISHFTGNWTHKFYGAVNRETPSPPFLTIYRDTPIPLDGNFRPFPIKCYHSLVPLLTSISWRQKRKWLFRNPSSTKSHKCQTLDGRAEKPDSVKEGVETLDAGETLVRKLRGTLCPYRWLHRPRWIWINTTSSV